jgi:hypothetical protein
MVVTNFFQRISASKLDNGKIKVKLFSLIYNLKLKSEMKLSTLCFISLLANVDSYPIGTLRCCNTLARPDDFDQCMSKVGRATICSQVFDVDLSSLYSEY